MWSPCCRKKLRDAAVIGVWLNTSPASPASPAQLSTSPAVNYITMARWRLTSKACEWDQRSAEGLADWASNRTTWPETCWERAAVEGGGGGAVIYTPLPPIQSARRWVATATAEDNTDTLLTGRCSIYRHQRPVMSTMAPVRPESPVMYLVKPL